MHLQRALHGRVFLHLVFHLHEQLDYRARTVIPDAVNVTRMRGRVEIDRGRAGFADDDTEAPVPLLGILTWRKSAASNPNGDCVELAPLPAGGVAVRNSRAPRGTALIYTRAEIEAFLRGAKAGEFDDLVT